jgi:hypothetical protein
MKAFVAIVIILIVIGCIINYATVQTFDAKLTSTYVDGGNTYLVFQKDGSNVKESYANDDSIWFFKFNSRDILTNSEVGKNYKITINGIRIPLFSMNQNIISMEAIN